MINLETEGILIHQNLPDGYSTLSEDKIIEIQNSLSTYNTDLFLDLTYQVRKFKAI